MWIKGGVLMAEPVRGAVPADPNWRSSERLWRVVDPQGRYEPVETRPVGALPAVDGSPYSPWSRAFDHAHTGARGFAGVHALGTHDEVMSLCAECARCFASGLPLPVPVQDGFESAVES